MKFCEFDASIEASEPHDFAVRLRAVRPQHIRVHRIPPRVRDDREPPLLVGRDGGAYSFDLGARARGIFLEPGLDRTNQLESSQQIRLKAQKPNAPVEAKSPSLELRFALFHEGAPSLAKILRVHAGDADLADRVHVALVGIL